MKIKYLSCLIVSSIICSCAVQNVNIPDNTTGDFPQPNVSGSAVIKSGTVSGSVKTLDNKSIANATVEIYKNDKLISTTKANTDGSYAFNNIPFDTDYAVKVNSNGYNDFWYYNVDVNNASNSLSQMYLFSNYLARNTVKGFVKDVSNLTSIQGALIKAFNNAGLLISTALVGANGSYNLDIPLGLGYYFELTKDNYQKLTYKNIDVSSGSAITLSDLALSANNVTFGDAQGSLNFIDSTLLSSLSNLPIKVYKNVGGVRYFVQNILSGLNGAYNFRLPTGSNYSFDVNYNGRVYTSNQFLINSGNNNLANLNFNNSNSLPDTSVVTQPSSIPSITPSVIPSVSVPTNPVSSGLGKILFTRNRQIYSMNIDGSNPNEIITDTFSKSMPRLSPDGNKILFLSNQAGITNSGTGSGIPQLFLMDTNGNNMIRITPDDQYYTDAVWSPDGSKMAYASSVPDKDNVRDYHYEIYIANADGSNKTRVTTLTEKTPYIIGNKNPSWSPDGSKLIYLSDRNERNTIYQINIDGSNDVKISTDDAGRYYDPSLSPDGTKIVFSKFGKIYTMNSDGSNEQQLTMNSEETEENYSNWSPDGTKIIFSSNRDKLDNTKTKSYQIYIMNADGSNQTRITTTDKENLNPSWSK